MCSSDLLCDVVVDFHPAITAVHVQGLPLFQQVKALTARFNRALSDSLTAYQRDHRAVIIVAPAVVGGAEDITAEIQQSVAARMAEGK